MPYVSIVFDVEDYVTPPEGGIDDLTRMLADVMTEQRVSGTFFVIGERMRSWQERRREDVIAALARHDIGSHTNLGSIHPTVTERAEDADWSSGVSRMAAEELAAIDELSAIAGRPIRTFARHGGSFCPQLLAALSTRGIAFAYSPARLPNHHITWYCNTLNFYLCSAQFQEAYNSRDTFEKADRDFQKLVAQNAGCDWLAVFHSHPTRIKTESFWDENYFAGAHTSPDQWNIPSVRPDFSFDAVRENWSLHCERLRDDPSLTVQTVAECAADFGQQAEAADAAELAQLAAQAAEADAPFFSDRFTAAEILDLLARAYLQWAQNGSMPDGIPRRAVFGPTQMPLADPTARRLEPVALHRVARGIASAVEATGILPSHILCGEGTLGSQGEVGPGTALSALGQVLSGGKPDQTVELRTVQAYPPQGDEIADQVRGRGFRTWQCHKPDLDVSTVAQLAALQSWTLKPAWAALPAPG
jgi:hypothetical protein